MLNKYYILYFEDQNGKSFIQDFIDKCTVRNQAKIMSILSLLEDMGPNLPRPYSDFLEDGIHELRIKLSGNQIRILYFFCYKNFIILTHFFRKKTDKVPKNEIIKCKKLRDDFLKRFNENYLKENHHEDF